MSNVKNSLKDPFPKENLHLIDLGHADGHRDKNTENTFITTKAINQFNLDRHSIIIGPYGTGKSTLFKLLKSNSKILGPYVDRLVVPVEEQIQFDELRNLSELYFSNISKRLLYQLVWKLHICKQICKKISTLEGFPRTNNEKYLNEFLSRVGVEDGDKSITKILKDLCTSISFKIKAKITSTPIEVEVGREGKGRSKPTMEINLENVFDNILRSLGDRCNSALVIIDKLDKFVTNEDYQTQKEYIESLLEVEDDLQSSCSIGFKIFLRSDLYHRLNLSSLGPDKVSDNTLKLCWSSEEISSFIAKRLFVSLIDANIWKLEELAESTDLSDMHLRWHDKVCASRNKSGFVYRLALFWRRFFVKKRSTSLFDKIDCAIFSILFDEKIVHACEGGGKESISIRDFIRTHFLDGHDACTPRHILIFLKKVICETIEYYRINPDLNAHTQPVSTGWGWGIFSKEIVYSAYCAAKKEYVENVVRMDEKWTRNFSELVDKLKGKSMLDYKWICQNISAPSLSGDFVGFLSFLEVIGFLKVKENNVDIKKRKYVVPIIYKQSFVAKG
ncbi:hypothetical protein SAMN05660284_02526 [Formivibrio citricus]|uniref:Uncharacterized protein n=1 Tax=Formivibrio citricus TaxID=83765 RepID=A0A1I5CZC2_9NEIS|nr:hypothetical protein [Formivibrio citricus]SFN92314.1 hypothetical protein SAMN05660284_02526 [Formivibrio citricus]